MCRPTHIRDRPQTVRVQAVFHQKIVGPTQASTAPRLTANASQNIEGGQEDSLILCQTTAPVVFHQDTLALSLNVLTIGSKWTTLWDRFNTTHAAKALTKTATPNTATPAYGGSGKRNSNCVQPTDGQIFSPSPPAGPDSDIMLAAIFGGINGDSNYVESAKNSLTSSSNMPDLKRHI